MNRYIVVDLTPFFYFQILWCILYIDYMRIVLMTITPYNKRKMIVSVLGDEVSFKVRMNWEGKYPEGLFILENHGTALLKRFYPWMCLFHFQDKL